MYEGTANIANVRPTKLVRRADGTTLFPTRSSVCGSARNVAKVLGYSDVSFIEANAPANKTTAKKAAKKSSVAQPTTTASSAKPAATTRSAPVQTQNKTGSR
jgi:hypothetical protein